MADEKTTVEYDIQTIGIRDHKDLRTILAANYHKQIVNFFGEEQQARRFLSAVMADVQRTPKLLDCKPVTLINSYLVMAELGLMPSGVSGEAYVLPYNDKNQGMIAQFQLGYQGLVTLLYRAGARQIVAEIVRKNDKFSYKNGEIEHEVDPFSDDRGEAIGAYVIVFLQAGGKVAQVMSKKEILAMGEKFSKSYKTGFTPWKEQNDPNLWMWKKTVLKQVAKLVPKNETVYRAVDLDNQDSIIADEKKKKRAASRLDEAKKKSSGLSMGSLLNDGNSNKKTSEENQEDQAESEEVTYDPEADHQEPPE